MKCPQQWRLKYIDEIDQEKSDALVFGSAIHKAISLGLSANEMPDLHWSEALEQVQETPQHYFLPLEMHDMGVPMLEAARGEFEHLLGVKRQNIDKKVKLELTGIDVPIIGYVDLIVEDDFYFIPIDFKTSKRKWSQAQADKSLQPTFYLAALNQSGMIKLPATFKYIILTKTKMPQVQVIETKRTAQDVFRLFDLITSVWDAMQKEAFPPTDPSNWWCSEKYCGVWNHCKFGGKT